MIGPRARTAMLFAAILALFVTVGGILGAFVFGSFWGGLAVALGLSLVLNLVSYYGCDRFVLWANRAQIVTEAEAPRLGRIVRELAPMFGVVEPRLAIIPTQTPNAFATGRDERHAVVAATEGILRRLDDRQLRAVLAHELAHVKDRDVLVMTFAATLAGAISYAAQMVFFSALFGGGNRNGSNGLVVLFAAITAPIAAALIQLAISRSRELRADEVGARTIRDPIALADALGTLEAANAARPMGFGSPASSSLFIVNPFRGGSFAALFSTHPPTEERIRRLRSMQADFAYRPTIVSPGGARFAGRPARPIR
ncbi:MAG TPA: M48 family metalloprotease [Thermoplasmata archaeon]|nr:M48 family metalloprotease [Thermoplasmata archaeon]